MFNNKYSVFFVTQFKDNKTLSSEEDSYVKNLCVKIHANRAVLILSALHSIKSVYYAD